MRGRRGTNCLRCMALSPLQRLRVCLLALLLLVGVGTLGYMLLEGWRPLEALYMTVITLSTVGFREVKPLNPPGMAFTMGLIGTGVGVMAYAAGTLGRLIIEGELAGVLGRRRMQRSIDALRDHFVVCGYGRVGKVVARELAAAGLPLVIVDTSADRIAEAEARGYLCLRGDATSEEVLERAGIARARGLLSCVGSDADNLYITLTARGLNPQLFIIARTASEEAERKLRWAGANRTISPHLLGGMRMAQAILQPHLLDFIEVTTARQSRELQMEEVEVRPGSWLAGKTVREADLRGAFGLLIITVKRPDGTMIINPPPEERLEEGDLLIVIGEREALQKLEHTLQGSSGTTR